MLQGQDKIYQETSGIVVLWGNQPEIQLPSKSEIFSVNVNALYNVCEAFKEWIYVRAFMFNLIGYDKLGS